MHYRVAELNEKEFQAVKKVEAIMEEETGKKYVMIAWEKEKIVIKKCKKVFTKREVKFYGYVSKEKNEKRK